jgi:hypothetical protein
MCSTETTSSGGFVSSAYVRVATGDTVFTGSQVVSSGGTASNLSRLHQLRGLGDAKVLKSLGHSPKGRHYRG